MYKYESYASGQIAHSRTVRASGHTVMAEIGAKTPIALSSAPAAQMRTNAVCGAANGRSH